MICERILHRVHRIIFGLQQERWRRAARDLDVRIQREGSLSYRQMTRIQRDCEVRATAHGVGRVDDRV